MRRCTVVHVPHPQNHINSTSETHVRPNIATGSFAKRAQSQPLNRCHTTKRNGITYQRSNENGFANGKYIMSLCTVADTQCLGAYKTAHQVGTASRAGKFNFIVDYKMS